MLVLTRKRAESLIIADSILVTVVQIEGGKVRLGIDAPPHIRVLRQELRARCVNPETADRPILGRRKLNP
jgi:carbon storage regulator